tara:strand:- start:7 stop:714 length:708 start_codon:yes stop_codon:yes gene_type:complete
MSGINHAMVLAAGRGERMRPLSDHTPKPLIEIAGRSMLDRMLDRLSGCNRVVVNTWHLADQITQAVAQRSTPPIVLSHETTLLDTGGGVRHALPSLGGDPFFVVAGDVILTEAQTPALSSLEDAWDATAMDALLLLVPRDKAGGFKGKGDFFRASDGRLRRRGNVSMAPFVYASIQIVHPRLFADAPDGPFSFNLLWDRALAADRLFGVEHTGGWCTVDRPENVARAEQLLKQQP